MGTKWIFQLPILNVNLMLYAVCTSVPYARIIWCVAFSMGQIVPLWASYVARLAFTGILTGEILAPQCTPDYPPSQMAPSEIARY